MYITYKYLCMYPHGFMRIDVFIIILHDLISQFVTYIVQRYLRKQKRVYTGLAEKLTQTKKLRFCVSVGFW